MNTPGIEIAHRCEFMGLGGIYNAYLKFKDVKIPAENLLVGEGRGLSLALSTINVGRLTLPAACTGAAKQCLEIARRWGKSRIQWGMPIGLHEAGREKVAFIAATTLAMEAVSWLTCGWQDKETWTSGSKQPWRSCFVPKSLWKIVDLTMQLRGGRGYEKARSLKARGEPAYAVERIMRDCRINLISGRLFRNHEAIFGQRGDRPSPKKSRRSTFSQKQLVSKGKDSFKSSRILRRLVSQTMAARKTEPFLQRTGTLRTPLSICRKNSSPLGKKNLPRYGQIPPESGTQADAPGPPNRHWHRALRPLSCLLLRPASQTNRNPRRFPPPTGQPFLPSLGADASTNYSNPSTPTTTALLTKSLNKLSITHSPG